MPKTDPPTTLTVQPIIKGDGAEVAASDTIVFNYRWYTWDGKLLEDSYDDRATDLPAVRTAARAWPRG